MSLLLISIHMIRITSSPQHAVVFTRVRLRASRGARCRAFLLNHVVHGRFCNILPYRVSSLPEPPRVSGDLIKVAIQTRGWLPLPVNLKSTPLRYIHRDPTWSTLAPITTA